MELVYLWVEKYKNIEKQGFNFSPKFRCEYNPENNELKIEEKDYTPIFPDNINITAIVGKNGSGKSSILKCLDLKFFQEKKSFYLYYDGEKFYSNFFEKDKNGNVIEKSHNDIMLHFDVIFANKLFFLQTPDDKYWDFLFEQNIYLKYYKNGNCINIETFNKNILFLILSNKCTTMNFFNPKEIKVNYNLIDKSFVFLEIELLKIFTEKYKDNIIYAYKIFQKSLELLENTKLKENSDSQLEYEKDKLINFLKNEKEINNYEPTSNEFNNNDVYDFLNKIFVILNKKNKINDFYQNFINDTQNFDIFYYLVSIGFLEYDFFDKDVNFKGLSSGEKSLFLDFCLLNKELNDKVFMNIEFKKNIIILLDEPDITLHPEWQKKYINMLVALLKIFNEFNFNVIITSHSPFIISDLPKENIIFLNKDENGKCIVVDGLNEKKETFGANIHTLLSDSFFMENGLIGEFAKSKIDDVIKYLNNEDSKIKNDDEAQRIIHIIGEPIIKKELQKMLDSKRLKKVKEIDKVQREMRMLKNRMEKLERILNEKDNNN